MRKSGFTLVELSIVLVIIGLLIGGILVAQSMIGTARLQTAVRQIQSMDVAIQNFQTKYNGLPGDAKGFGGNGNGQLNRDPVSQGGSYYLEFTGEAANFWVNLQQSGFMSDAPKFSSTIPSGGYNSNPSAPNSPTMAYGKNTVVTLSENSTGGFGMTLYYAYSLGDFTGRPAPFTTGAGAYPPSFTPAEALAFDMKLDDGNPALGNVNTGAGGEFGNYGGGCDDYLSDSPAAAAAAKYTVSNTGTLCFLSVGILGKPLSRLIGV